MQQLKEAWGMGGCLPLTENTQVSWNAFVTFPRHRGQVDVTAERNVAPVNVAHLPTGRLSPQISMATSTIL